MESPSEWFVRGLELLDSNLHVRWGSAVNRWVIDRDGIITQTEIGYLKKRYLRAVNAVSLNPDDLKKIAFRDGIAEEYLSAQAGRRIILYAKNLDRQIFESLMLHDIQRYGGYARAIVELESKEIAEEKDRLRMEENRSESLHKEFYDQINFVERKKQNELLAGYSWRDLLKSGRSREPKKSNGSLGEYKIIDRRRVQPAEAQL